MSDSELLEKIIESISKLRLTHQYYMAGLIAEKVSKIQCEGESILSNA